MNNNAMKIVLGIIISVVICTMIIYLAFNMNSGSYIDLKVLSINEVKKSNCFPYIDNRFNFIVTFNKSVDKVFVNNRNIFILDSCGNKINTKLSIEKDDRKIKVIPLEYFEKSKRYSIYITNDNHNKEDINPMKNTKVDLTINY